MKSNKNIDDTEKKIVESSDDVGLAKPKPKVKKVTKKKTEKVYSEEDLNVALYYEISSTIYNSLNNLIVRKAIFGDEQLLKILELQISNLFFLEKELKELKDKKYALEFLQLISNLVNRSLSITKSSPKNRIEILEERNLLIVTITNVCKTVEKESLERIRQFDDNTFTELNDQIVALNNFSDDSSEIKPSVSANNNQSLNDNVDANPNVGVVNNPDNNLNINNLDNASLANLTKLGVLPQHPATNPKFYPYMNKPKYIPLLKKILAGFFLLTTVLTVVTYILTYFVAGEFQIKSGGETVYYNFGQQLQSMILTIIMTIVLNGGFLYSILKPPKLGRDLYRTSYFLIVILILWVVYTVTNLLFIMRDDSLLGTFNSFLLEKGDEVNPKALSWLKGLSTFKAFQILTYVTTASAILPIAIILVIAILNPRIDRNKIMRANTEYQNAINNALSGKPYEMDPTLFDDSLDNDNKKDTKDHKFWRNSDLFK